MEISKPVQTVIERDFTGVKFTRVYHAKQISGLLNNSNGIALEVAADGIYFGFFGKSSNLQESAVLSILTRDKRSISGIYHSGYFFDLAIFQNFRSLNSPFGEQVKILFGAEGLRCLVKVDQDVFLKFTFEKDEIEVYFDSIAIIKRYCKKEVIYYLTDSIHPSLCRILTQGTNVSLNFEEFGCILPWLEESRICVDYTEKRPSIRLKIPKAKLDFKSLKCERNFLSLSGTLNFIYPKSSSDVVYIRNFEAESKIKSGLETMGFELSGDSVFAHNDLVVGILTDDHGVYSKINDFSGSNIQLSISQDVTANVSFKKVNLKCSKIEDSVSAETNLSKDEFRFLFETLSDDSLSNRSWLSYPNKVLLLPFKSLEFFRLFIEYFNGIPSYETSTIRFKNFNDILFYSFLSFCEGNKSFKLINFEETKKRLSKLTKIKNLDLSEYPFLRDYQTYGVSWLIHLYENKLGGLLADEMGLGKTVQALVALDWLFKRELAKNALVICPTSVVRNWEREAKRFTPNLDVFVFHGPGRKEELNRLYEAQLIITTYTILRFDEILLEDCKYSIIVIDEAQLIKNVDAVTTKIVKNLKADVKFALTGTPIENRPLELWSIFDFILEKGFGSKSFFKKAIEKRIQSDGADRLAKSSAPFILRRLKKEALASLPPKIETVEVCEMTPGQREIYETYETNAKRLVESFMVNTRIGFTHIFSALTRLRQICNHPLSLPFDERIGDTGSGKFSRMLEIVDELILNDRKVVIFCQFLEMINLIQDSLKSKGIRTLIFTGATRNRFELIDSFNKSDYPCVLVMSLKAGGLGVNLTGASDVILYDPWWNPQVENQAIDRLHRIGQENVVFVYRLLTEDSIESRMEKLKERKMEIFEIVLSGKRGHLDIQTIRNLLG